MLPRERLEQIDALAGQRKHSEYIAKALSAKLARARLAEQARRLDDDRSKRAWGVT